MRNRILAIVICGLVVASGFHPSAAQTVENFYKAQQVKVVVGYTPGGSYDLYARLLARHMSGHIPGHPTVIVQNMPGAGSLKAVLYLDASAPKDGTVVNTFNAGLINDSFANPDKIKMKFSDLAWLGSITRDFRVCYALNSTGIKTWDDLVKRDVFIMGAIASGTGNDAAIIQNVFGVKLRRIMGYPGGNELKMAIERGELDGNCGSWSSIPIEWVTGGKINVLVQVSSKRLPDMPENVPFIYNLATTDEQRALLNIFLTPGELGRPFVMSHETPKDRLQAMRTAFDTVMADKAFLAEADTLKMPVYPVSWQEAEETLSKVYASPPELVEKARDALKE